MSTTYDPLAIHRFSQPTPADGWLVSEWAAGQSTIMNWSPDHVRTAADGATELVLDNAPAGSPKAFLGGEFQSDAVATTGTWSWTAEAPDMVDGAVFGMFTYKADYANDPWLEFDFEFVGADTSEVELTVHMEDAAGNHITNLHRTVIDLGFDAADEFHTYELTLTGTGAVFRADGEVIAYFSGADMPGGVWNTGELKSFVDLWAADPRYDGWTGHWTDPGEPLVGRVADAEVRPGDVSGAMPILGTGGANALSGTSGRDVVDGLAGNDMLSGGAGDDRMMGGYGHDTLQLDAGNDWLDGGDGSDWVRFSGSVGATVDLGNWWGSQNTGHGTDSLRGIENASGSSAADKISGGTGANQLKGQAGDDWVDGREGADQIWGGFGRDGMSGGVDRDVDVFVFNSAAQSAVGSQRDYVLNFVSGIDEVDLRPIDANTGLAGNQAFAWGGTQAAANSAWYATSGSNVILKADTTGDGVADFELQLNGLSSLGAGDLLL